MLFQLVAIIITISVFYKFFKKATRKSYQGKVVIITGASSGIGEALALEFAKQKLKLVLAARRVDRLEEVVKRCKSLGSEAIVIPTDVAKQADCKNLIEKTVQTFGQVDVLVLNAGIGCLLKADEFTEDFSELKRIWDVNYWGCVYPTHYALQQLRKSHGTVISISSLASKFPTPRRTIYGSTKSAVNAFFNCLRVEEPNIQFTNICPGFVLSEIHDKAVSRGPLHREKGSFMTAERCAEIIVEAAAEGRREEVMTPLGKAGVYMNVFAPSLVDWLAMKKAEASVKKQQ